MLDPRKHPHKNVVHVVFFDVVVILYSFVVINRAVDVVSVVVVVVVVAVGLAAGIPSFLMCMVIKNQVQQVAKDHSEIRVRVRDVSARYKYLQIQIQIHSNCLRFMAGRAAVDKSS